MTLCRFRTAYTHKRKTYHIYTVTAYFIFVVHINAAIGCRIKFLLIAAFKPHNRRKCKAVRFCFVWQFFTTNFQYYEIICHLIIYVPLCLWYKQQTSTSSNKQTFEGARGGIYHIDTAKNGNVYKHYVKQ